VELAADTARLADTARAAEGTVRLAGKAQAAAGTARVAADTAQPVVADTAHPAEGTRAAAGTAVAAPVAGTEQFADTAAAAGRGAAGRTQAPKTAPRRVGELLTLISASCEWL
jgi:hypothetical protein